MTQVSLSVPRKSQGRVSYISSSCSPSQTGCYYLALFITGCSRRSEIAYYRDEGHLGEGVATIIPGPVRRAASRITREFNMHMHGAATSSIDLCKITAYKGAMVRLTNNTRRVSVLIYFSLSAKNQTEVYFWSWPEAW